MKQMKHQRIAKKCCQLYQDQDEEQQIHGTPQGNCIEFCLVRLGASTYCAKFQTELLSVVRESRMSCASLVIVAPNSHFRNSNAVAVCARTRQKRTGKAARRDEYTLDAGTEMTDSAVM